LKDGNIVCRRAGFSKLPTPQAYGENGGVYDYYGEQRNRGLELSPYGEPLDWTSHQYVWPLG